MQLSIERKMIIALAKHEQAKEAVSDLSSAIGRALCECSIEREIEKILREWGSIEHFYDEKGRTKTHLWQALNGQGYDRLDGEVTEYLSSEETGCPACLKAWEFIQQRKDAKQHLGVARRLIRHYGKRAIEMLEG